MENKRVEQKIKECYIVAKHIMDEFKIPKYFREDLIQELVFYASFKFGYEWDYKILRNTFIERTFYLLLEKYVSTDVSLVTPVAILEKYGTDGYEAALKNLITNGSLKEIPVDNTKKEEVTEAMIEEKAIQELEDERFMKIVEDESKKTTGKYNILKRAREKFNKKNGK